MTVRSNAGEEERGECWEMSILSEFETLDCVEGNNLKVLKPVVPRGTATAFVLILLTACGGGSGGASDDVPPDTARLSCNVSEVATGKPVADATVTYQAGATEYTTQTNTSGVCQLDMPATAVAGVQYPAATVTKPEYEPQTILCLSLQAGKSCSQSVQLNPLAENISIPVGGDTVMHLGDGSFEGAVNSQFQKASDGAELNFAISDWAAQVAKPGITKATVYLDAKGWQSNICDNLIGLVGDAGSVMLPDAGTTRVQVLVMARNIAVHSS